MLSQEIRDILPKIREYLKDQPIVKAWLFGSCSRGEETADSDIDLLVTYDDQACVSLLTVSRMRNQLRALLDREVDLVEDGYLKPFAVPSAEHDKIVIYERDT